MGFIGYDDDVIITFALMLQELARFKKIGSFISGSFHPRFCPLLRQTFSCATVSLPDSFRTSFFGV